MTEFANTDCGLRKPCQRCGGLTGTVTTKSGQDVVTCACGTYQYCMPKSESGRDPRTVRTRDAIKPSTKVRVLTRFNNRCVICHGEGVDLHVGHLISLFDADRYDVDPDLTNHEANMAAMCVECNLGLGDQTAPSPVFLDALRVLHDSGDFDHGTLVRLFAAAMTIWKAPA